MGGGGIGPNTTFPSGEQRPANPNYGYNQQGQFTPMGQLDSSYSGQQFTPTPQTPASGFRPIGDQQFYQPVYQQQYQNYANPYTQMGVSQYGQQPQYGGFEMGGGYGMQQMQTPFNPYTNSFGFGQSTPAQQPDNDQAIRNAAQQSVLGGSGPQQPIYSRSAGMRGTPNVRNYAEGGITSLLDGKE